MAGRFYWCFSGQHKDLVEYFSTKTLSKFGDGAEVIATRKENFPAVIGRKKKITIESCIENNEIPLLLSKTSIKKAGIILNFLNDTAFIPYILVDASGWVVSDVSFGFMGGFRVFQHQTPSPKWPSWHRSYSNSIPAANLRIPTRRKKWPQKRLYI